jgi:uracil-DNA glycosylase family 4
MPIQTREQLHKQFLAQASQFDLDIDVISDGPVTSEVVIIAEGLGENEIRQKRVLIGGAGRLLFDSLRKHGLHRANVYATNVVKRQISLSRTGNERHVVHQDELERWRAMLDWELSQLPNVRIVLALGNYALEAITGHRKITNWRGSVLPITLHGRAVTVVCSINPAFALREPKMEPMFLMDLAKLGMVLRGTYREHEVECLINPTAPQARTFISDLNKAKKPIAFDIETINGETACFGLSNSPHSAMCIALRGPHTHTFTLHEELNLLHQLQALLDNNRIIAQNGSFDAYWTRLHDRLYVPIWFDTLLAHHTLYPQLPHNLAFIVGQYTTHPFYKDEGKLWKEGGDLDRFWRYNCADAALTYAVHERLKRELTEQGLDKFFFGHVMRAQPHLVSATVHGVAIDVASKAKVTEQASADVGAFKAKFHALVHEATEDPDYFPNPNSWQQLQELLFNRLGLRGRGRSTDATNRQHILNNPATRSVDKELIIALDRYLKEDKFLSTYAEARISDDNRMRCEYKQYGVTNAPGRLSSAQLLDNTGMNLQNQPQRARALFITDPGFVFVYFDLAQAEARIVAWRAAIMHWQEQFEQARVDGQYDAHRALASEMFKVPYAKVPKHDFKPDGSPTTRYIAKRCRHGLNYRMQREKLAEVTGLSYYDASRAFALYHATTPELQQWWVQEEREFRKTRTMYNALGRRWRVIQRLDERVLASVVAFYPQSTIGDLVTRIWYMAEEDDQWPSEARVCLNVHDNLVGLATPKQAKTALKVLRRHAETPIKIIDAWGHAQSPLIIPAELKMSVPDKRGIHRWSNMKVV